MQIVVIELKI